MILPDANTLLYAVNTASPQHRSALEALEEAYRGPRGVGFAWVSLLAFLRLSTRRGMFEKPLSTRDSLRVVQNWLAQPEAQVIHPGELHCDILEGLLKEAGTAENLTTDAHIAALAIEHGATVLTYDRDFARFQGLRWATPA